MDFEDLKRFAPAAKVAILHGIADSWHLAEAAGITTPHRICHFLSQLAHESDGFRTTTEYATGKAYEGRADLGNTQRGDGMRFKGRGLIQVTGRANYRAFSPEAEQDPDRVSAFPWAFEAAVWYWRKHGLNRFADANDIRSITKRINGGYNGLADRRAWFRKAVAIWGEGEVNEIGKPVYASRTVKASLMGGGGIGISALGYLSDVRDAIENGQGIAEALGVSWPFLLACTVAAGAILYIAYDRWFIAKHEGL